MISPVFGISKDIFEPYLTYPYSDRLPSCHRSVGTPEQIKLPPVCFNSNGYESLMMIKLFEIEGITKHV